ncbi:MAG: 3-dehydroquinate synthase family protein [Planctomycetales bacterium]
MPHEPSTVRVQLGPRSYDITIVSDALPRIAEQVARWTAARLELRVERGKAFVVTDAHVREPHAEAVRRSFAEAGWQTDLAELPPGEKSKDLAVVSDLYDRLVAFGADRRTLVVAVGGGVIGDAAGFAAATYARGLPFVQVPTTLLAQVDSSVGGKVGVNHPRGKNLIGAFHQPLGVFIDTATLRTLPERAFRSGLAEVVKYGVILDADFFGWLEAHAREINERDPAALAHVVARSCRLKADVVEQDEFETLESRLQPALESRLQPAAHSGENSLKAGLQQGGLPRAILNYGHTFAHAFETLAGYGALLHGEAVAIGIVCASRLAERRGLIDAAATERQISLLQAFGLPTALPTSVRIDAEAALSSMRLDKKSVGGRLRFVLPTRLGHVETFADVPETDVRAILEGAA